jgi:hypothetical protein
MRWYNRRDGEGLLVESDHGHYRVRAVVSATGTWSKPYIPIYPGQEQFRGMQIHSADYRLMQDGQPVEPAGGLGDIVMAPSVKEARTRGVLHDVRAFAIAGTQAGDWRTGQQFGLCNSRRPTAQPLSAGAMRWRVRWRTTTAASGPTPRSVAEA